MTPEQKYRTDPDFAHVVGMLEAIIHDAKLTPAEIRLAATLACIHYQMQTSTVDMVVPREVEKWLDSVWATGRENETQA